MPHLAPPTLTAAEQKAILRATAIFQVQPPDPVG